VFGSEPALLFTFGAGLKNAAGLACLDLVNPDEMDAAVRVFLETDGPRPS